MPDPEISISTGLTLDAALAILTPDPAATGSVTFSAEAVRSALAVIRASLDTEGDGDALDEEIELHCEAEGRAREAEASVDRLRMAFLVLSESGHGGGMFEVRRWFSAGATGPIPWPGGALFEAWAEENGIGERDGAMVLLIPGEPAFGQAMAGSEPMPSRSAR